MNLQKISERVLKRYAQEVDDVRRNKSQPFGFVIMIDKFMSGWGKAPERSYYAIAVDNQEEADIVMENAENRSEMKSIRLRKKLPKIAEGDHLKVTDKYEASNWFEPNQW